MKLYYCFTLSLLAASVIGQVDGDESTVNTSTNTEDALNDVNTDDGEALSGETDVEENDNETVPVVEVPTADACFTKSEMINGRDKVDFPVVSDIDAHDELTADHVITEFKACYSDTKVVGMQLTYGVWTQPEAPAGEEPTVDGDSAETAGQDTTETGE